MRKGEPPPGLRLPAFTRRHFLASASALALAAASPRGLARAPSRQDPGPPEFPPGIPVYRQTYQNWCGELLVPDAWTAAPRWPEDVAVLANWAADHGWRVRAKGMSHGWSPLLLPAGRPLQPCLLVDAARNLDQVWVTARPGAATVTAQAGITLDQLWEVLGKAGLAVAATPAPGHLTLGGALAIGAHGTALATPGAGLAPGWTFGSLSNAVLALEAVAWDDATGRYALRTFHRGDPAIGPLLVHAGRAFLTAATLQVGSDVNLRLRSFTDIPVDELFAPPASAGPRSFQAWAERAGRVEATWFPFTDCPWLRVWSPAPEQPEASVALEGPYPFTFANWVTREESACLAACLRDQPCLTPAFLEVALTTTRAGLFLTGTGDVWGPSRFTTLHVLPSTVRYHVSGHAILCRASDIQRVASELVAFVAWMLATCRARGEFPVNGPMDLRLSGLDRTAEVDAPAAQEAQLSPLRPRPDQPRWDCAVWVEILTLPGTPGAARFYADLEAWLLENYRGDYASVRVEWAKGWAYSSQGAWTAGAVLDGHIPGSFTTGYRSGADWAGAVRGLQALDPRGLYGNAFLDAVFRTP